MKFSNGLNLNDEEGLIPRDINPTTSSSNLVFSNGLKLEDEPDIQTNIQTQQYPEARELLDLNNFKLPGYTKDLGIIGAFKERELSKVDNSQDLIKFTFSSDPRDKIEALKGIMNNKGYEVFNPRVENDEILVDVKGKNGEEVKTYSLNKKGFSKQDVVDFSAEAVKYYPAAKGAMVAKGAATGLMGAGRAIAGAGAGGAASRLAEEAVLSPTRDTTDSYFINEPTTKIEGINPRGMGERVMEGAITGAAGEGIIQGASPLVKYVGGYLASLTRKYITPTSVLSKLDKKYSEDFYSKSIEEAVQNNDTDKLADIINTAMNDNRIPSAVRAELQAIKEGTQEGMEALAKLQERENIEVNPLEIIRKTGEPQPISPSVQSELPKFDSLLGQKTPSLGREMSRVSTDRNTQNKINLVFNTQDEAFKDNLYRLTKEISPMEEINKELVEETAKQEISSLKDTLKIKISDNPSINELSKKIFNSDISEVKSILRKDGKLDLAFSKSDSQIKDMIIEEKGLLPSASGDIKEQISKKYTDDISKINKFYDEQINKVSTKTPIVEKTDKEILDSLNIKPISDRILKDDARANIQMKANNVSKTEYDTMLRNEFDKLKKEDAKRMEKEISSRLKEIKSAQLKDNMKIIKENEANIKQTNKLLKEKEKQIDTFIKSKIPQEMENAKTTSKKSLYDSIDSNPELKKQFDSYKKYYNEEAPNIIKENIVKQHLKDSLARRIGNPKPFANIIEEIEENSKLEQSIMFNENTKSIAADLTKFNQVLEEITRGRKPIKEEADVMMLFKDPADVVNTALQAKMSGGWSLLSKTSYLLNYIKPEEAKIAADLLTQRVPNRQFISAMEKLRNAPPETYIKGLSKLIKEYKGIVPSVKAATNVGPVVGRSVFGGAYQNAGPIGDILNY